MQLLESALHENQLRITKFEEAIGVKDQVSFNPKKNSLTYSDNSIKNTVLRPNQQYKASTAKMA